VVDTKISALPAVAAAVAAQELAVNDAGVSKKVTVGQLETYFEAKGMNRCWALAADHAISAIAATEVTGLGPITLEPGTYKFEFYILAQSATATVSPMFGVNFTGTAAVRSFRLRYPSTGTAAISGVADDAGANSGQIEESMALTTFQTTAPTLGATGGVATINTNILYIIEGVLVVTVQGDLELWHGSETATSTTVKAGSVAIVTRVA
jgi:hypothetical protein